MMDPLRAGASVVDFLKVALTSAKTIHDVLSAIKDGPEGVERLTNEVAQLQHILERLSQIPFGNATDVAEMADLARKCANDVAVFESRLQRLQLSGADCRRARFRRRIQITFSDKDLEQMRDVIRAHVLMLNFRLNLVQTTQLSLSTTQSSEILGLLQQLKGDVAALHQSRASGNDQPAAPAHSHAMEVDDEASVPPSTDDTALDESISRLTKLVAEKECTVDSEDAEQLIQDLETLLASAQRNEIESSHEVTPDHPTSDHSEGEAVWKELKLVNNLISSAPSLTINRNAQLGVISNVPQGTIIEQTRKRKEIDLSNGVLSISTVKRRRRYLGNRNNNDDNKGSKDFVAKLVFKPNNAHAMIAVSVNQGQVLFDSFISMAPRVSAINILPKDSLVFQLAAGGKVQDLMALVAEGKASLRDHDTEGWSLLHHAIRHPTMCKFLIQNGLDVDEIAFKTWNGRALEFTPLHFLNDILHETGRVLLEAGADPTILVRGNPSAVNKFAELQDFSPESILRQIFTLCHYFEITSPVDHMETTPFLMACSPPSRMSGSFDPQQHIQNLAFMLDRGCSINATDKYELTCLHSFFLYQDAWDLGHDWKEVLIYLIRRGADVHAVSAEGWSVSAMAYGEACKKNCPIRKDFGSYFGDLWDVLLDTCGYEIIEFRKSYPRKAQYVEIYSRQDFELLWEGREHRCPYWDDEIWPDIEHDVEKGNQNNPKAKDMCARWHHYEEPIDDGSTTDGCSGSPDGAQEYGSDDDIQALSAAEVDSGSTSSNGEMSYAFGYANDHDIQALPVSGSDSTSSNGELFYVPHQVNSADSNSGHRHEMVSDHLRPVISPRIENYTRARESSERVDNYHREVSASQNDELFDNPWSEYRSHGFV
ncbi:hypothetical protein BGZ61DRAFT_583072 [Ilyonectria robusta]|uniref:uncharacterized protein n=1 Tax=Ilyonectria robusta TaxID=1079257 RepID=UPI001E8D14D0|nr:uncharacterized protein BGZ61DRAFT_583072 [Ilyonectria robusta]KAH8738057.1 hypothetical protein BGZ61DRAFT_583072 [Ilyonectria robusta]